MEFRTHLIAGACLAACSSGTFELLAHRQAVMLRPG
jgi:hypothetical protein